MNCRKQRYGCKVDGEGYRQRRGGRNASTRVRQEPDVVAGVVQPVAAKAAAAAEPSTSNKRKRQSSTVPSGISTLHRPASPAEIAEAITNMNPDSECMRTTGVQLAEHIRHMLSESARRMLAEKQNLRSLERLSVMTFTLLGYDKATATDIIRGTVEAESQRLFQVGARKL